MGLLLLGYAGLALAIAVVAARDFDPRRLAATAGRFAVVALVALVGGAAFWPWAQEQPLMRPFEAFFLASGFSWGNPSLFMGEAISGTAVPWYYLPTWIGITIPAVVLVGLAFAVVRLASAQRQARARLAALWAFVLVSGGQRDRPARLTLYDGIRHMFFIVPPMAVLAAAGWDFLLRQHAAAGLRRSCRCAGVDAGGAARVSDSEPSEPDRVLHAGRGRPARRVRPVRHGLLGQLRPRRRREWSARQAERARHAARRHVERVGNRSRWMRGVSTLYFRQQRHGGWHLDIRCC